MPSLKRHFLKTTTGLLAGLLLAGVASAQGFPTKPVTLMIPYPAGGLSDNIARRVNVPLGAALGGLVGASWGEPAAAALPRRRCSTARRMATWCSRARPTS